jgi:hypothetical protein
MESKGTNRPIDIDESADIRLIAEVIKLLSRWHVELGDRSPVPKSIHGYQDSKVTTKSQRIRKFYDSDNRAHPRRKPKTINSQSKEV